MPYRDPAQRAAWMREYRKRKRAGKAGTPVSSTATPSFVRTPDSSRLSRPTIESSGPQPAPSNAGYRRKAARSSFKTALDLARTFPLGSSLPGYARIAITRATVRQARGAAIVEVVRDESGGSSENRRLSAAEENFRAAARVAANLF
jgi:hypothetical protein